MQTQTHHWLSSFGCRLSSILPGPAGWQTHSKGPLPRSISEWGSETGKLGWGRLWSWEPGGGRSHPFVWPQVTLSVLCPFPGAARTSYHEPGVLTTTEIRSLTVPEARSPEARWCQGAALSPRPLPRLAAAPAMLSMPRLMVALLRPLPPSSHGVPSARSHVLAKDTSCGI